MSIDSSGNVQIANDSGKLQLGASQDLQIYHDGSHSFIRDIGTGALQLSGNRITMRNGDAASEYMFTADENGAVELYYDNSKKFETNSGGVEVFGHLKLDDSKYLKLGNSSGTQYVAMYHNGYNFHLQHTSTGSLYMDSVGNHHFRNSGGTEYRARFDNNGSVKLYYDSNEKFRTTSTGVEVTGNLTFAGDSNTHISHPQADYLKITTGGNEVMSFTDASNIFVPDSRKLMFGDHVDLQIYHDTENYIKSATASVNLILESAHDVYIKHGGENMLKCAGDGAVELYYDNSKKFETTSSGVSIPSDTTFLQIGAGQDLDLHHNGTNSYIRNKTGNFHIRPLVAEEGIILKPNGAVELYHDNEKKLYTYGDGIFVQDDSSAGAYVVIATNAGTQGSLYGTANTLGLLDGQNHYMLKGVKDGAVELYYDNSKKLETTSSGITVTGSVTTQDMNMSNLNGNANEVDNTKGSWSIQEGSDDLFIINRVTGKKYKFNLTEIS